MNKIIAASIVFLSLGANYANACIFADDPSQCRAMRHCDEQGLMEPFCYLGSHK